MERRGAEAVRDHLAVGALRANEDCNCDAAPGRLRGEQFRDGCTPGDRDDGTRGHAGAGVGDDLEPRKAAAGAVALNVARPCDVASDAVDGGKSEGHVARCRRKVYRRSGDRSCPEHSELQRRGAVTGEAGVEGFCEHFDTERRLQRLPGVGRAPRGGRAVRDTGGGRGRCPGGRWWRRRTLSRGGTWRRIPLCVRGGNGARRQGRRTGAVMP
mmetsp:Transcript_9939/g.30643  ORF Transcript_9939/g.30643 Transcript_9939/m.30643 type:complete len:213 (-) Transcript_9939:2420-3058(-)